MEQSSKNQNLVFLILGVLATCSGIYLTFQKEYLIGISSTIVGISLAVRNYKEYKTK